MKTKLLLMLLCAAILTSCAGKFGVMKRRYNKGYYVSVSGDHTSKPTHVKTEKRAPKTAEQQIVITQRVEAAENKVEETPVITSTAKAPTFKSRNNSMTKVYASAGNQVKAVFRAKSLARELKNQQAVSGGAASSVEPIVLVILCIFLPPLAVYLFHNAINADFWLSLILTLLFWVPGIIYAFLVCFAGVSIA